MLTYEHAVISQRETVKIPSVSHNTISNVINTRKATQLDWDQVNMCTESELEEKLFPEVTDLFKSTMTVTTIIDCLINRSKYLN